MNRVDTNRNWIYELVKCAIATIFLNYKWIIHSAAQLMPPLTYYTHSFIQSNFTLHSSHSPFCLCGDRCLYERWPIELSQNNYHIAHIFISLVFTVHRILLFCRTLAPTITFHFCCVCNGICMPAFIYWASAWECVSAYVLTSNDIVCTKTKTMSTTHSAIYILHLCLHAIKVFVQSYSFDKNLFERLRLLHIRRHYKCMIV